MRYTIVERKRARERKKESENPNSFSLVLTCNIRDIFSIFFVWDTFWCHGASLLFRVWLCGSCSRQVVLYESDLT